jgi:hypothetical protein
VCQTYVDVVVRGCLEWGGEELAREFLVTTEGWSRHYLNDAPLSRRPWLHRQQYRVIDRLLQESNAVTQFDKRKHPEEFAAQVPGHSFYYQNLG